MRPLLATLLALVAWLAAGCSASASAERDLLPDLVQEVPSDLSVRAERRAGGRRWLLGFRSAVRNAGEGPLILDGSRPNRRARLMRASQVVRREDGTSRRIARVGSLRFDREADHSHWHLLGFERYSLTPPGSRRVLVRDGKRGFCLGDRYAFEPAPAPAPREPAYTSRCGLERPGLLRLREGISVGHGDDYAAHLEGQSLDITRLPAGRYTVMHRVNPDATLLEATVANNASSALVEIRRPGGRPRVRLLATCANTDRCPSP